MISTASDFMLAELLELAPTQASTTSETLEQALKQKLMRKKGLIRMKKVLSEWELRVRLRNWKRIIQHRQGKYELEEGEILDIHLY
jgi:hypothetical protein